MFCRVSHNLPYGWDQYVLEHKESTFFHQTKFLFFLEKYFKWKGYYCYSIDDKGGLDGILPLILCPNSLEGRGLVSLPHAVYGGILAQDPKIEEALYQKALQVSKEVNADFLFLKSIARANFFSNHAQYYHFRKKLSFESETNWKAICNKKRADIRKSKSLGFELHIHQCIDIFYEHYASSLQRLGTPILPISYFESLLMSFNKEIKIFSAMLDGKILASVLVFFFKDEIMPYYAGALEQGRKAHGYDFIYWALMEYAIRHGYPYFNFGRSRYNSGPFKYKSHWGFAAEPLSYNYVNLKKPEKVWGGHPDNTAFQKAVKIWQKLPLSLTLAIGPWIAVRLI